MTGRKPGQKMLTFWLPEAEWEAARTAAAELDTTISDECRRALRNTIRRAEKKRTTDAAAVTAWAKGRQG